MVTGQGGVVAQHGHAEAIADEDHFDAGLLLQVGGGVVVAGEPGDGLALGDLVKEVGQGDLFSCFGHFSSG